MLDWLQLADTAHLKCVVLQVRVLYLAPDHRSNLTDNVKERSRYIRGTYFKNPRGIG